MTIRPGSLLGTKARALSALCPPRQLNNAGAKERQLSLVHEWICGAVEINVIVTKPSYAAVDFFLMQRKWKSIQPAPFRNFELTHQESIYLFSSSFLQAWAYFW